MPRRKTTVYLDADVLTATKVLAAAAERSESQVVEEALCAYLRAEERETARDDLRQLMDRVAKRNTVDDDDTAMNIAVDEVHAARTTRQNAKIA